MARKSSDEHGPRHKVLLVEGTDDLYCIGELLQARNVPKGQSCNIKAAEGFSGLREDFAVRLRVVSNTGEPRQFLGVVADADKDPQEHWDALRNLMAANGYTNLPAALPSFGYSHPTSDSPAGQPLVAVWLMPGNGARRAGRFCTAVGS